MTDPSDKPLVLILGAGINGAAAARELVLNGVGVCLVDTADIATGATSRSSRLIHGGLRYLEYGEYDLVSESLQERSRLLKNAPHFVRPLRLHIPIRQRTGGFLAAGLRFFGANAVRPGKWLLDHMQNGRGLWTVRTGLLFYDMLAGRDSLPRHTTQPVHPGRAPRVDSQQFRWLCSYWDAQIEYPERFVLAMLADAQQHAREHDISFSVHTYHRAEVSGAEAAVLPVRGGEATPAQVIRPRLIVNATGAWGDRTLGQLPVESPSLFAGTKGSHFFTRHEPLLNAIGEDGIYAEAADGRLVFILPVTGGVWVGTTDERFEGDPGNATASEAELDYLVALVNEVLEGVQLETQHIEMHCAGVRPLPRVNARTAAAIPRGHSIVENDSGTLPVLTLVGGKLTTCRALGEEVATNVFERLGIPRTAGTRERPLPGAPETITESAAVPFTSEEALARREIPIPNQLPAGLSREQYVAVSSLVGDRFGDIFPAAADGPLENLSGTHLPLDFVRWVTTHEWTAHVSDLVERRLMLLYHPELTHECLSQLAQIMVEAGRIQPDEVTAEIEDAVSRLQTFFGRQVV